MPNVTGEQRAEGFLQALASYDLTGTNRGERAAPLQTRRVNVNKREAFRALSRWTMTRTQKRRKLGRKDNNIVSTSWNSYEWNTSEVKWI